MLFKIRKLPIGAALKFTGGAVFALLLSGCDLVEPPAPPIPPVKVADVTTPSLKPDTPPLYCKIGRGTAAFGREWYDFRNVEFELYGGQAADISLMSVQGGHQMTIRALFDGSGQKLIFCPVPAGLSSAATMAPDRLVSCASLYALDEDLHDGIKRTFDIPAAVRGGEITCAYDQERLRSLKPPPE